MSELSSDKISVINTYMPEQGLTLASLEWLSGSSTENVYSIPITPSVSLKLDKDTPVRPTAVIVLDEGAEESAETLSNLFGLEFVETLLQARKAERKYTTMQYKLSADNRFAIAEQQLANPDTSDTIQRLCAQMLFEHGLIKPEPISLVEHIMQPYGSSGQALQHRRTVRRPDRLR